MPCKANSHGQKSGLLTWSSKPSKSGGFPFCIEGNCDLGQIICSSVSRFVFISIVGSFKAISFTKHVGASSVVAISSCSVACNRSVTYSRFYHLLFLSQSASYFQPAQIRSSVLLSFIQLLQALDNLQSLCTSEIRFEI